MKTDEILVKIRNIMDQNGIFIYDESETESLDMDSLTFMSIIVDIENEFKINIPESFFLITLNNYLEFEKELCNYVEDAINNRNE